MKYFAKIIAMMSKCCEDQVNKKNGRWVCCNCGKQQFHIVL